MNVIIIHGIPDNEEKEKNPKTRTYDKHWIPWLCRELIKKDIESFVPLMPEPWDPDYKSWCKKFEEVEVGENSVLIGHSGGCAFLVRWLGEHKTRVKKLILVAPWKIPSEEFSDGENDLYDFDIDREIKDLVDEVIIFTSNDEEEDGKKSAQIYTDELNGKLIELKDHGHYCLDDMHTEEFPELLDSVLHNL